MRYPRSYWLLLPFVVRSTMHMGVGGRPHGRQVAPELPASFPRPPWQSCERFGAAPCAGGSAKEDRCCCPAECPCREGVASLCRPCGAFLRWRRRAAGRADAAIVGLLFAPRCTMLLALVMQDMGYGAFPLPRAGLGLEAEGLEAHLSATAWLVPHAAVTRLLWPMAEDSFWWVLGLAHASLVQWAAEAAVVMRVLCGTSAWRTELAALEKYLLQVLTIIAAVLLAHSTLPLGAAFSSAVVTLLLAWYSARAAVAPWLSFTMRNKVDMALHLSLALCFVSFSKNAAFDLGTLLLFVGPVAVIVASMVDHFRASGGAAARGATIVVERARFFESSIERLTTLDQKALQAPPFIIYGSSDMAVHQEAGIDFGGLRRDWLGQLAANFFDPARGLVEHSMHANRAFARLRPGADRTQLEALGKVLGLAIRDGLPLGVDICPPLAHLLLHPRLPLALAAIRGEAASAVPLGAGAGEAASAGSCLHGAATPGPEAAAPPVGPSWGAAGAASGRKASTSSSCSWSTASGRAELARLGFSRDWLRWVSEDEYRYWTSCLHGPEHEQERATKLAAVGGDGTQGGRLTLSSLPEHMARRALQVLVLDVAEETQAVWRGLHTVPGVPLPAFDDEVRGSKRRATELEAYDAQDAQLERQRKRRCTFGPSTAKTSVEERQVGALGEVCSADMPQDAPLPESVAVHAAGSGGDPRARTEAPGSANPPEGADTEHGAAPGAASGAASGPFGSEEGQRASAASGSGSDSGGGGAKHSEGERAAPAAKRRRLAVSAAELLTEAAEGRGSTSSSSPVGAAAVRGGRDDVGEAAPGFTLQTQSVLQLLLSGGHSVPVTAWQAQTRYEPVGAAELPEGARTIQWFWAYAESLDDTGRAALLEWVTGYRRLPTGGFPPPIGAMTIYLADADSQRRPSAHTCALQLDLPRSYRSAEELRYRLLEATACNEFHLI